jgi:AbrB family looped-hinge helix DNA binding protein
MGTPPYGPTLYGTATVGPKGQIVIPAEARKKLKLQTGDKVIIMGAGHDGSLVALCPAAKLENMLSQFTARLETLRAALDKDQNTPKEGHV